MRAELDETAFDGGVVSPVPAVSCIVAIKPIDPAILEKLQEFGIDVVEDDNGIAYLRKDPVYIFNDFASQLLANLKSASIQECGHSPRVMGPPYIRHYLDSNALPPPPPRNRSRYCCTMLGVFITVELKESTRKKEIIDCIHYMSGSARRDLKPHTTHFVADNVRSDMYKKFGSLGKPMLRPTWILEAWRNRDDPKFDVNSEQFINKHVLACFEGLRLHFRGIFGEHLAEMEKLAIQKLADVVLDPKAATHVIVGSEVTEPLSEESTHSWQVTEKWFWDSIQLGRALCETSFNVGPKCLTRMRTPHGSKTSILEHSHHSFTTPEDRSLGSPCKMDKKYHIASEMLTTEKNYIDMLELLMQMKHKLMGSKDDDSCAESWIACNQREGITIADANMIFGKIGSVVRAHKKIYQELSHVISNWNSHSSVGNVWLSNAEHLMKAYPPFINTFDTAMKRFSELDKNERFHAFVRSCESDEQWRKQRFGDLLVRPVQRLPSIQLLLEQCMKASKKSSTDAEVLSRACKTLQQILSKANESRRRTENYEKTCRFFDDIENLPVNLRSSARQLQDECSVMCLGGSGDWSHFFHRPLRLIVFNDLLLIVKVRERPARSTGTLSRMARHFSTSSLLGDRRKPYKFIMYFTFTDVRKITAYQKEERSESNFLYLLLMRDNSKGDEEVLVDVDPCGSNAEAVHRCLKTLEHYVFYETGREDLFDTVPLQNLPEMFSEAAGVTERTPLAQVKSPREGKENVATTSNTPIRKAGTLRKAISGTSMFRRFTGMPLRDLQRTQILEESVVTEEVQHRTMDLRQSRATQSSANLSFFSRTFRRPSFKRYQSNLNL